MARVKTTVYLDKQLLRAAKGEAARSGRQDYEVLEDALRRYLGFDGHDRVSGRVYLPEGEAEELAYRELGAARKGRPR